MFGVVSPRELDDARLPECKLLKHDSSIWQEKNGVNTSSFSICIIFRMLFDPF